MDIPLPEVDGLELIHQLKAHPIWQKVPLIAITAAIQGDRDRYLKAGADEYLSKPLDLEKVITTVRSFIETETAASDSLV
jgi:CheY-like chemotaxis protein